MKRKKKLTYGAKLAHNLLLFLFLGVLLWGLMDFSVPTVQGRFRMIERANWAGPSDIQGFFDRRYDRCDSLAGRRDFPGVLATGGGGNHSGPGA